LDVFKSRCTVSIVGRVESTHMKYPVVVQKLNSGCDLNDQCLNL
jgi:hypothetical protein